MLVPELRKFTELFECPVRDRELLTREDQIIRDKTDSEYLLLNNYLEKGPSERKSRGLMKMFKNCSNTHFLDSSCF